MSSNNIPKVKLEKKAKLAFPNSVPRNKSESSLLEPMINEAKPKFVNVDT